MTNKGIAIKYNDVAPEAKENFEPSVSEKTDFVDLLQLQKEGLKFKNFACPCELYQTILDGTAIVFPSEPEAESLGLWSEQVSNEDGDFTEPIVLTLTSAGQYSSQGLTLTFDTYNGIFANYINIKWYRETETIETLSNMDFYPDNAFYFCRNLVENYNKVVITFYSMNMPKNRLKLCAIDYGYSTFFYGNELRNVKQIQEINPISTEISINTADFTLDSKADMEYSFQAKQPLSVYFNGSLISTNFVKSAKRQAKRLWQVQSEDYIGLMDSIPFPGGMYDNKNAVELITEIFAAAKVPYSIDEVFSDETVTGHIPYTTCRDALMQVAFAIQAVVDTSYSDVVKIFALDNEIKQTVPLSRIMQGQSFTDEETVTGVEITVHSYTPLPEEERDYLYKAEDSGAGTNILVMFSEPQHNVQISSGKILELGTNYALINAETGCQLWGQGYKHITSTKRKNNPVVLASEIEKIVSVQDATLVSNNNADMVLEKCYDWLTNTRETSLKIVEGKHISGGEKIRYGAAKYGEIKYGDTTPKVVTYDQTVNVGDIITYKTEYMGEITGRIIKETFNLNGGIIIKEANLK